MNNAHGQTHAHADEIASGRLSDRDWFAHTWAIARCNACATKIARTSSGLCEHCRADVVDHTLAGVELIDIRTHADTNGNSRRTVLATRNGALWIVANDHGNNGVRTLLPIINAHTGADVVTIGDLPLPLTFDVTVECWKRYANMRATVRETGARTGEYDVIALTNGRTVMHAETWPIASQLALALNGNASGIAGEIRKTARNIDRAHADEIRAMARIRAGVL